MKIIPKQKPLQLEVDQSCDKVRFVPAPPPGRACEVCGALLDFGAVGCPHCGNGTSIKGAVGGMRYAAIPLNENGKALVCPHCENEELTPGDFCMICGNDIVNRCADTPSRENPAKTAKSCGNVLPGNARYCSRCGNEGTFFQKGWLRDWKSENTKKAIGNVRAVELPRREEKA